MDVDDDVAAIAGGDVEFLPRLALLEGRLAGVAHPGDLSIRENVLCRSTKGLGFGDAVEAGGAVIPKGYAPSPVAYDNGPSGPLDDIGEFEEPALACLRRATPIKFVDGMPDDDRQPGHVVL